METGVLIVAIAIMALGTLHIIVTPRFYKGLTIDTLWFISGGLTLIFLAFLNIILVTNQGKDSNIFVFCQVANCLTAIFLGFLLKIIFAPQVLVGFLLVLTEVILVLGL
jgi:hypothetical protein